jgi:hypothetical protein
MLSVLFGPTPNTNIVTRPEQGLGPDLSLKDQARAHAIL